MNHMKVTNKRGNKKSNSNYVHFSLDLIVIKIILNIVESIKITVPSTVVASVGNP